MQYMQLYGLSAIAHLMVSRLAALRVTTRLLDKKIQVLFGLVIQNEACYVSQCRLGYGADLSKGGFSSYHSNLVDVSDCLIRQ